MRPYELGLYEKALPKDLSFREKLETAREAGYDFLEISIDESPEKLARLDWTGQERADIVTLMEETNLPVRSMCLSGHRKFPLGSTDPAVREQSLRIMEKALILADHLGIRIIQLAGYDVYYEPSTDETAGFFKEGLERAARMAAQRGVLLGFETMETGFMNTVGKAMRWVRAVDSPYLQVYPDLGNLTNAASGDPALVAEDLASGRGHLAAMHLKETRPGIFREVPFGTGHVDFESGIRTAWEMGVRRYVTEFWDVGDGRWREEMRTAQDLARKILEKQKG